MALNLDVEEAGSGPPLVLVHGSWDDRHVWDLVNEYMAQRFHVVSYDRRGHGDRRDQSQSGTRRDDEDDLAGVIGGLDLAPANVVGNSFGGSIALGLAARRPELFGSLCVHEPPLLTLAAGGGALAELDQAVRAVLELIDQREYEAAARDFVESVALGPGAWQMLSPQERATMAAHAPTFAGEQRDAAWADIDLVSLEALDIPVLLTQGDQSPPFFSTVVARLSASIDRAEVRTLPGVGHVPHMTHPREYAEVITGFVGDQTASHLTS